MISPQHNGRIPERPADSDHREDIPVQSRAGWETVYWAHVVCQEEGAGEDIAKHNH